MHSNHNSGHRQIRSTENNQNHLSRKLFQWNDKIMPTAIPDISLRLKNTEKTFMTVSSF